MATGKIGINRFLLLILALGLVLRLQGIDNPLLDDQAWRQTDTAGMAWHMQGNLLAVPDVFYPYLSYDGTTPQQVELEFPLFPYLLAWTWQFTGQADLWGRVWAIGFSMASIIGLYQLGKTLFSQATGLLAAFIYAILPLSVYYGRVIMPEPLTQALAIWAVNTMVWWRLRPSFPKLFLAGLFMAAAILTKLPQMMVLPVAIVWGFSFMENRSLSMRFLPVYMMIALAPPVAYYVSAHAQSSSSGQFVSGIITGQVVHGNSFWQALSINLSQGISYYIIILALIGLLPLLRDLFFSTPFDRLKKAAASGLLLWGFIALIYTFIICLRIPLDYYLVPILPPIALLIGFALSHLNSRKKLLLLIIVGILLAKEGNSTLMQKLAWDDRYLIQAEWIKQNTDPSSILILSDAPPMTFYYSQRIGFRLTASDEESLIQLSSLPGDYLVKSPRSNRSLAFWERISDLYPEVGPGVYLMTTDESGR